MRTVTAAVRYVESTGPTAATSLEQLDGTPRTAEIEALPGVDSVQAATFVFGGLLPLVQLFFATPGNWLSPPPSWNPWVLAVGAGAVAIGVLTGLAPSAALAPHADAVLACSAELAAWLDSRSI